MLLCLILLVAVSIPVSFFAIRKILNEEVDESLALHSDQFIKHIKTFEYLDDLEMDLGIWDQLSYDITITPGSERSTERRYQNMSLFDSVEHEQRPFRILSTPVEIKGKHYMLTIRMSLVHNDELVIAMATVQVVIVIFISAALLLLNRRFSERLWRPFYHTLNQLKAYELDRNESIQPAKTSITEFVDLNKTVINLTDRNRKSFLQQNEFIENASHELQTPLAIFQSKLDVLMQNSLLDEQSASAILELEDTAQRMARLNKNLLLLSKIDNNQFTDSNTIDIADVAMRLLDNLYTVASMEEISVVVNIHSLILNANATLIEVLLTNLFHNAIRYSRRRGEVNIQLKDRTLVVSNLGQPLTMSADQLFDRFSKEGGHENSTGLGLAIVKKICDTTGYKISYSYHGNGHHFKVVF